MKKLWLAIESVSHYLSGVAYELPYDGRNPLKTILIIQNSLANPDFFNRL